MHQIDRWAPSDLGPPRGPFKDWVADGGETLTDDHDQLPVR